MTSESSEPTTAPDSSPVPPGFRELGLPPAILQALDDVAYELPSQIQGQTIPALLAGRDLLGQAPTGTGKTAAFALPILARLDLKQRATQALVLTPTRELAIQVAEAFQRYAAHMPGFHVLPVYGGQAYPIQLRPLARGVHVVVGTPGRIMDHMKRGTLQLDQLRCLVLDEADEMLRMGFQEDVAWILEQTPPQRQTVLFSATIPEPIRKIASRHLTNPEEVRLQKGPMSAVTVRHRFQIVGRESKLDALTRFLEVEEFDGMLVFVRTRTATTELAERLAARGYSSAPLSGEMPQRARERTVDRFKSGKLDILVATDVAARGLDVDRISHVINYDAPHDAEAYVHRIGRTGRAGRTGEAILFMTPRERSMLRVIERATSKPLEPLTLPSTDEINKQRIARFKERVLDATGSQKAAFFTQLMTELAEESERSLPEICGALANLAQGDEPLLLQELPRQTERPHRDRADRPTDRGDRGPPRGDRSGGGSRPTPPPAEGEERYRVEVGRIHGVRPNNIVGAITAEADLEGKFIGRIEIHDRFSTVDLPVNMPPEVFEHLRGVKICNQRSRISRLTPHRKPHKAFRKSPRKPHRKGPGQERAHEPSD